MDDACKDYWDVGSTNLGRGQYSLLLFACPFSFYIASLCHSAFERTALHVFLSAKFSFSPVLSVLHIMNNLQAEL